MSNLATVISIVPRLPPAIDGVGDYALNLARQLRKDFDIQTHFIVGNPQWQGAAEIEGFPVSQITDSSANTLLTLLSSNNSSSPILLHYVGYGYAKRGCPTWLVEGLQRWKSLHPKSNLVTMFHELYASGYPPWTSSFWLSSLQKHLLERLVNLSDNHITSKQSYAETLCKVAPAKQAKIISLPVFSNIGEPEYTPELVQRKQRLVIFGHKNGRLQIYKQHFQALEQLCQLMNIEEVCDIGVSTGVQISAINGIPLVKKGVIEAEEISSILLDSVIGFLNFPPPTHLAKSTIFAAYCAHGLIPCMANTSIKTIDDLQAGKHYWSANNTNRQLSLETGQEIANNAYTWYQTHSLPKQSQHFFNLLKSPYAHKNYPN